jgi:hypothetical protein
MRVFQLALPLALTSCLPMGCDTQDERQGMVAANVRAIQEGRKTQAEISTAAGAPRLGRNQTELSSSKH